MPPSTFLLFALVGTLCCAFAAAALPSVYQDLDSDENVPQDVFHSLEYRTFHNRRMLERNLQQATGDPGWQAFNDMIKDLSVGFDGTLALPNLLGVTPIVKSLSCSGLSLGGAGMAQGAPAANMVTTSLTRATVTCQSDVGFIRNGKENTVKLSFGTAASGFSIAIVQEYTADAQGNKLLRMADENACNVDFEPSLNIISKPDAGFWEGVLDFTVDKLVNLLGPAFSGVVGGLACSLVRGAVGLTNLVPSLVPKALARSPFVRGGGSASAEAEVEAAEIARAQADGEDDAWFDFASNEKNRVEKSPLYTETLEAISANQQGAGTPPDVFSFADSDLFNTLSSSLNNILGKVGEADGPNANRLVVNDAAERLAKVLGDPTGNTLDFASLLAAIPPIDINLITGLSTTVALKKASIQGANTFTAFKVLEPSLQAKQTVNNKLAADTLRLNVEFDLAVKPTNTRMSVAMPDWFRLSSADAMRAAMVDGKRVWTDPNDADRDSTRAYGALDGNATARASSSSSSGDTPRRLQAGTTPPLALVLNGLPAFADTISLSLALDKLVLEASTLIAIQVQKFLDIPLAGLTAENTFDVIECILVAVYAIQFPTLAASATLPNDFFKLDSTNLKGLSALLSGAVNFVVGLGQKVVGGLGLSDELSELISGILQQLLNGLLEMLTAPSTIAQSCSPKNSTSFVDTGKKNSGDLMDVLPISLDNLFNSFLGVKGDLGLVRIAREASLAISGVPGQLTLVNTNIVGTLRDLGIASDAQLSLAAKLTVSNVTTLSDNTTILKSDKPLQLQNLIQLGPPFDVVLDVDMSVGKQLFTNEGPLSAKFQLRFSMGQIGMDSLALLRLDLDTSAGRRIRDLGGSTCPLSIIGKFQVLKLDLANYVDAISLDLVCDGQCSSSVFNDIGVVMKDPAVASAINEYARTKVLPFVEQVVSDSATWELVDQQVLDGPLGNCDAKSGLEGDGFAMIILVVVGVFALLMSAVCLRRLCVVLKQDGRDGGGGGGGQRNKTGGGWRSSFKLVVKAEQSLAFSRHTSTTAKCLIAILLVANLVLFGVALASSGGVTIAAVATYRDGSTNKIVPGGASALASTGDDGTGFDTSTLVQIMVNGNAYLLAGSVGFFSGALPFMWVLSMIYVWFAPPTIVSVPSRGWLLLKLSSIGRWTLVLPILLMILTVGVRINFTVGSSAVPDALALDLFMVASWGIFLFMFAVLLAMSLNKTIMHIHRNAVKAEAQDIHLKLQAAPNQDKYQPLEALRNHVFKPTVLGAMRGLRVSGVGQLTLMLALGAMPVLLVAGVAVKGFNFTLGGVVAAFIGTLNEEGFSLFDMVRLLGSTVDMQADGAVKVVFSALTQSFVVVCVFVAPLIGGLIHTVMWLQPMTVANQRKLFIVSEWIESVVTLEVYIFTVIVAALQLNGSLIAAFLETIGGVAVLCQSDSTGQAPLVRAANAAQISDDTNTCADVQIMPLFGMYLLIGATVLRTAIYASAMRASNASIEDRELQINGVHYRTDALFSKTSTLSRLGAAVFAGFGCLGETMVVASERDKSETPSAGGDSASMMMMMMNDMTDAPLSGSGFQVGSTRSKNNSNSSGNNKNYISSSSRSRKTWRSAFGGTTRLVSAASASMAAMKDTAAGELPPGWERLYDPATRRYYYANQATGVVTWNVPQL